MKRRMICWSSMAVLLCCLAIPAVAAPDPNSSEPKQRPRHGDRPGPGAGERWKQLDQDNDGRISRSEWKRDEQAFSRIDSDNDGFLTQDELRNAAKEFRGKHRRGFQEMDTDGDGNISKSEWKGKEELFSRLDANNDGSLTRDELREARKRHGRGAGSATRGDNNTL
ncbi:MAG: EF-hand domain-containing protein [Acidobacteria bacterium]|nr:EF-hand domain-containing protein [Acidobacteriota bacterium]MCI0719927.1 EF-hand domain-containing protein [Acidobacteriota bacterium]